LFQFVLHIEHKPRQRLGVGGHPAVGDLLEGQGIEVVVLEASIALRHHEVCSLQHLEVLHHSEPRHPQPFLELGKRQSPSIPEGVE
jgi:hypothetical protein